MLRVRGPRRARVAVEQRAAVVRREQPLVRVDDERVGALDAGEQRRGSAASQRRRRRRRRRRAATARGAAQAVRDARRGRRRCRRSSCRRRRRRRRRRSPAPSSTRGSAGPVSRPRSSPGTSTTSTSITSAAERIEECASAVQASAQPPSGAAAARGAPALRAVCRAATRAERLPVVPPLTKRPAGRRRASRAGRRASRAPGSRRGSRPRPSPSGRRRCSPRWWRGRTRRRPGSAPTGCRRG